MDQSIEYVVEKIVRKRVVSGEVSSDVYKKEFHLIAFRKITKNFVLCSGFLFGQMAGLR